MRCLITGFKVERGGGGSWDDAAIEHIAGRLGIALHVSPGTQGAIKRKYRDDLGCLQLHKKFRNEMSHGSITFAECGEYLNVSELRDITIRTVSFIRDVVVAFRAYIDSLGYFVPARRPVRLLQYEKVETRSGRSITAVDLFCGAGGLTHGLIKGGVKVVAGIDLDNACRYPYEKNNSAQFFERDIKALPASAIKELFAGAEVTLLAGCAPCQPFSTYSRSDRKRGGESEWELVASFGRLVRKVQPHLVTMENVPQVEQHPVFSEFLENLTGYQVSRTAVECDKIGIPQTRKALRSR